MKNFYRELIILILCLVTINALSKETRIRVAVLDTGVVFNKTTAPYLCKDGHADFTGYGLDDNLGHGTNVIGLIAKRMNPRTHCIVSIKYMNSIYETSHIGIAESLNLAYRYVLKLNVRYVNLSLAGVQFDQEEYNTIATLLRRGVIITVAAGNNRKDLSIDCNVFPACYNVKGNYYVVASKDGDFSNYGGKVNRYRPGLNQVAWGIMLSGSSQASANQMAMILERDGY